MPEPDMPRMEKWVPHLSKAVGNPDARVCLVGHSMGCITILRYLEGLSEGQMIGSAVLVGGFSESIGYEELNNFFLTPVDWEEVKRHCSSFTAIHSDNDPYVPLRFLDTFRKELSAVIVVEHGKGHMGGEDNLKELPSALAAIEKNL